VEDGEERAHRGKDIDDEVVGGLFWWSLRPAGVTTAFRGKQ
jgi:hypothetical protein